MIMHQQSIDQAGTLRNLHPPMATAVDASLAATRVISITSGKGGVGKTSLAANLALSLAKLDQRVLIIDADLGLANIDVVFGLTPRYNLNHYFNSERSLTEVMTTSLHDVKILPAGSGLQQLTHLDPLQKRRFLEDLDELHDQFDYVLIDTEAGISENVTYFNVAAHDILVVTTPEPTAITDAYALMKLLSTRYHQKQFYLVVNQVQGYDEGLDVYQKLTTVSNRYLDISIEYFGCIPSNERMVEAIRRQTPLVELYPGNKASGAFDGLARSLTKDTACKQPKGTIQFFWNRFFSLNQGGEA